MKFKVIPSERWLTMGATGSGKTIFNKYLLREISKKMQVVIVDEKNFWLGDNPVWEENKKLPGTVDKPHLIRKFNPDWRVQVFQSDGYDSDLDRLCKDILKARDVYFYIDDNDGLCNSHTVPIGLSKIWKQGRALRIGASDSTQTYKNIPSMFRTQAEKFVVFQVGIDDIEDAANLVNVPPEDVENLGEWEYIYLDKKTMRQGLWFPPLKVNKENAA